ncbi:MAG TPA: 4-(cytidine 5'-diphospho)-2-C-methyl-D-erythritol kinase [Fibrobacter sp.]|nr:4-(cytidine 5'-diphospho)-2-C-methyl-D-erythritol kinase [Fibrobacter sp.]
MIYKEYAPAKINLFLDVVSKREDGYHDLGTAFQTIDAGDTLEASLRKDSVITLRYNKAQDYPVETDLVYRAAHLLQSEFNVKSGADLYLNKIMPIGAGLGAGSADAAAALRLLNKIWGLSLTSAQLESLGTRLGADVPFLIQGGLALAEGIGDHLTPMPSIDWPTDMVLLVATPLCFVPTKAAYAGVKPSGEGRWHKWKSNFNSSGIPELFNKFEESVLPQFPEISKMKSDLIELGALSSLMSGSGASVFAFFESAKEAGLAAKKIENKTRWLCITKFFEKKMDLSL